MDWDALKEKGNRLLSRYKYVALVILIGMVLMAFPFPADKEVPEQNSVETDVNPGPGDALEQILSQIEGVGRVKVLLMESTGSETLYQTDEDRSSDGAIRVETVIVTDENRAQKGLVRSVIPPSYRGAIVVCQGADLPSVKLAVVEAVSNVTGLGTDRIAVLKMK